MKEKLRYGGAQQRNKRMKVERKEDERVNKEDGETEAQSLKPLKRWK